MTTKLLSNTQTKFLRTLKDTRIPAMKDNPNVSRDELLVACAQMNMVAPPNWIVMDHTRRVARGIYSIPEITEIDSPTNIGYNTEEDNNDMNTTFDVKASVLAMTNGDRDTIIPTQVTEYVPWGHFDDIEALLKAKNFVTVYITGLSGNGKTTMIEQVCAKLKRECFRLNIVGTTDEDDLFGGLRLVNGDTVWQDGAVIQAMKRGAVLLLDEVDLGSEKLMCLQPVLEGKGVYIKKKNEWVIPAEGFAIVATANTKGKGSEDGRFVGTNVMNEAFLDRFDYTYEQDYAPKTTEKKILTKAMKKYGAVDNEFIDHLVTWAEMIRKSYKDGAVNEIISTRRLINICKAYSVFHNKIKAVGMSLARFDRETQDAFMSLYKKIDGDPALNPDAAQAQANPTATVDPNEPPF
jgi:MoxR-like ATPase